MAMKLMPWRQWPASEAGGSLWLCNQLAWLVMACEEILQSISASHASSCTETAESSPFCLESSMCLISEI